MPDIGICAAYRPIVLSHNAITNVMQAKSSIAAGPKLAGQILVHFANQE